MKFTIKKKFPDRNLVTSYYSTKDVLEVDRVIGQAIRDPYTQSIVFHPN